MFCRHGIASMTMPYLGDLKFGTRLLALAVDHANYRTVYFIEEYVSYCGQFQKILSLTAGATASTAQPKTHRNEACSAAMFCIRGSIT